MSYPTEFKKLLVPVDLTDASQALLSCAAGLAKRTNGEIHLLFVCELPRFVTPQVAMAPVAWTGGDLEGTVLQQAKEELDLLIKKVDTGKLLVRAEVEIGTPVTGIVRYAEREAVDLILMGTHGRSGLERFLLGSVAQRVVASAPCPVLTINPYGVKRPPSAGEKR